MSIEKVYSLKDLYKIIELDKSSKGISDRRFPVRFIFINSFEELREIVRNLTEKWEIKVKEVVELLSDKDLWLTPDEIVNWVKRISNNAVIVSLSEILRFQSKDDFYTTLKGLTEIETQNNIRIYIPLVGLWERFEEDFWPNFYRKEEWAPVWKLETNFQKVNIYQINFELDYRNVSSKDFTVISSTKEWLNIWKKGNVKGILSISKPLSHFCENFLPDQAFELVKILNQKDFLEKIFGVKVPIKFKDDEAEFWNELIREVSKYDKKGLTIGNIFLEHFNLRNMTRLTPRDFLALYLKKKKYYERWLIKNFFLTLDEFKSSYLYRCFKNLKELKEENLIEKLWLEIFCLSPEMLTKDIFSQRRELLNFTHKSLNISAQFIEKKLANKLNNIKGLPLKKKLEYLTNITFTERKYILLELKELKNIDIPKIFPSLKKVYPELVYYLDWDLIKPDNKVDGWVLEYFKEYNYSKVKHAKSPKIDELISSKNKDKSTFSSWYYSIPKAEEIDRNLKYVWIDGLGAEWFPLIVHLLNKYGKGKGKFVKKKMLTRVNLPSTTECNRYKFGKIQDLDNYIHNQNPYKYPDDLINEIGLIEKFVKEIVSLPNDRVCIVSDHGFSFLCLKDFGNLKRLDLPNAEHDGRCIWINNANHKDDEYFIVWNVDEGNCKGRKALVALKHVSLNNTPYREVHGGATPEEVVVPCIVIGREAGETKYEVKVINSEIWITNPVVQLKISPKPSHIPEAFVNKQPFNLTYEKENDIYKINLKGLKVGTHMITLKIGNMVDQQEVTIRGGFKEKDLLWMN